MEKVQKRATKILPGLKNLPYSERLKICKIPTLHYRRIRGDMIETYKVVSGKYQPDTAVDADVAGVHSLKNVAPYAPRGITTRLPL